MKRHCGICHLPGHDRRAHHRRNPDSEQLYNQYTRDLKRIEKAADAKKPKSERYWEKSAQRVGDVLDDPRKPYPKEFVTVRNRYGHAVVVPRRYGLESENKYRHSEDAKHAAHARTLRAFDRDDKRQAAEDESRRHEASHKRKLSYDAAKAKADRERRKREVSVSPTASKKVYEAAKRKAEREGKQLVLRARRGGGNIAQQNYFARKTGN